ncbi:MAG: MASE4 domain-containing protein, partial [Xanthobacteraceae bacterium]
MDEKDVDEAVKPSIKSNAVTIGVTIACILGVVVGLTWIVTERAEYLPTLFISVTTQTVVAQGLDAFLWILSATALLVLFVHRRTILDLWLMAILVVWWPNFVLPIFSPVVRFTLGWYVGRGFALLASSTLLIVLLGESTALYARLANAIQLLRRERADRLMTIEAATSAIVHEVRQPLTAIAMQSRAALRWLGRVPPGPEIEEIRQCLNSTTDAVNRAE